MVTKQNKKASGAGGPRQPEGASTQDKVRVPERPHCPSKPLNPYQVPSTVFHKSAGNTLAQVSSEMCEGNR